MKSDNSQSQFGRQLLVVEKLQGDPAIISRLNEIGIRQGSKLVYFSKTPFGGPQILRLGNTMFALREEELSCLILKKI